MERFSGGQENLAVINKETFENNVERVSGPGFTEAAYYELSKPQVKKGERSGHMGERLKDDELSQDKELVLADRAMFGVFDGIGGARGGREASRVASATVEKIMQEPEIEPKTGADLAQILNFASRNVDALNQRIDGRSATTGVLARIVENNGRKMLAYASVGDSRIYIVAGNGEATQITQDEGNENVIFNALGGGSARPWNERTKQYGEILLMEGDKIVLCSDGITGDRGTDLMDSKELASYVNEAGSTADAAQSLVENARKNDDRTAIVVEV